MMFIQQVLTKKKSTHLSELIMVRILLTFWVVRKDTSYVLFFPSSFKNKCLPLFLHHVEHLCILWSFLLCLDMLQIPAKRWKLHRELQHAEQWRALKVMLSIPVTFSLTWWGSSTHSKAILFWPEKALQPIWPVDMLPERRASCKEKTEALCCVDVCGC